MDRVRLAADVELEALDVYARPAHSLPNRLVGQLLPAVHLVGPAASLPLSGPSHFHVARGRRCHARILRVPGQSELQTHGHANMGMHHHTHHRSSHRGQIRLGNYNQTVSADHRSVLESVHRRSGSLHRVELLCQAVAALVGATQQEHDHVEQQQQQQRQHAQQFEGKRQQLLLRQEQQWKHERKRQI